MIFLKAELEIECKNPDIIVKSIEPDIDVKDKFDVKIEANEKIKVVIESKDITGLLAGVNSYLRLIRTAIGGSLDD